MDEQRSDIAPISGARLLGDEQPPQGMGDAKRLLYFTNLIAKTAGVPVFALSRQTPYGQISASVHGPLAFKKVQAQGAKGSSEEDQELVRLVWLPEGFVITPKTAEAPDGYGMPPTPNKRGTPGGPLRQVIINRFKDNQYPDAVYRTAKGEIPESTRVCAANLLYMDWELEDGEFGIGVGGSTWVPQFSKRFQVNFSEPETSTWYCHRPEYASEPTDVLYLREQANLLRQSASMPPLSQPIRGMEGLWSESPIYMAKWSGIVGHSNAMFRAGHQQFVDRVVHRGRESISVGENLYHSTIEPGNELAREAMEGWRNSPWHYATLTRDWSKVGSEDGFYAYVDSAMRGDIEINGSQQPPYEDMNSPVLAIEPPQTVSMATQIFGSKWDFVSFGSVQQRKEDAIPGSPRFLLNHNRAWDCFFSPYRTSANDNFAYRPPVSIAISGKSIPIWDEEDGPIVSVLSAAHVVVNGKDVLRLVTLERSIPAWGADPEYLNAESAPAYIVVRDGDLNNFWLTQESIEWMELPPNTSLMSNVKFSTSGNKAVFCYSIAEPHLHRFRVPNAYWVEAEDAIVAIDPDDYARVKQAVWGDALRFVEWQSGAGFSQLFEESLDIVPTYLEPGTSTWDIESVCQGSYKLFANYDGENLVYATVHVDSKLSTNAPRGNKLADYHRKLDGKIVFPDGSEFKYIDLDTRIETYSNDGATGDGVLTVSSSLAGTFSQILHMNIMKPKDVVCLKHDVENGLRPKSRCSLVSRGKVIKSNDDVIASPENDRMFIMVSNDFRKYSGIRSFSANNQEGMTPYVRTRTPIGDEPTISFTPFTDERYAPPYPYKASLFAYSEITVGGKPHGYQINKITNHDLVGPQIIGAFHNDDGEYVNAAFYKGEAIVAGKVGSPFGLPDKGWTGGDKYFYESSLDLKAITGIPDLKDDILPIGVV